MRLIKHIALLFAAVSFLVITSVQAEVVVQAELSYKVISIDGQVSYSINIAGARNISEPELPTIRDFKVYSSGRSFSQSIVNGVSTSSVIYKYILIPTKIGKFTIGPAKVRIGGDSYQTEPLQIEVKRSSSGSSGTEQQSRKTSNSTNNNEYIITAEVDQDTVFEGEHLVYTFKALRNVGARFFSQPAFIPSPFIGFWKEEFGFQQYNRNYKGSTYHVNELKTHLFPISPGKITIEPMQLAITLDNLSNKTNFDPFDTRSFFRQSVEDTLHTKIIDITVLPLPQEGRPRHFKGAVGDYNMTVKLSNTEVTVDETILLTIRFSGKGNIRTISPPDIPEIEGLDIRPSGDTVTVRQGGNKVIGNKTFEFSIIPEQEGIYDIPPIRWSYFDPESETYKTHKSKKHTVSIQPGKNGSDDILSGLMTLPGDIKVRDILAVKNLTSDLALFSRPLIMRPWFTAVYIIPLIILSGVIVFRKRQDKLLGDVRYRRLKRAHGMARKRLAQSGKLLSQGKSDQFYSEISRALYEYIGDKFNYAGSGLTESIVSEILSENNFSDELRQSFSDLIQSANFERFTPSASGAESDKSLHDKAIKWIVSAEQEGKKTK